MSKKCAKCLKTVYPTEELKCLDKIWHKLCFKCEVCGMTLNMKNYKGFEKLPYCSAHYPTTKPTAVADTPEARRIAENTKIQSNVQYHADFEKQKGFKTSVADDPETSRIKQNTQIQSNVNYWGLKEQREQMEGRRPQEALDDVTRRSRNPGKISDYDPTEGQEIDSPYSKRSSANVVYDSKRGGEVHGQRVQPGSIADYDPLNQHHSSVVRNSYGQSQPQAYQPAPPQAQPPRAAQAAPKQVIYRALYDYSAADNDEVSFMDGDHIVNVEVVDAGWMIGTVQRTGQHGMLPSNYVERIN
ncbi:LIM and SH3 domain protein F42H10.3-like isoform X4 [Biomphalaria glabrata]|uniref:LIM and SH3 domain protein F42H10.3-like isoform X4 n=1 Tax=Biomphalaria glabrata TaxID=6526 RepID=A0A2C9K571_BIOGL|nr:LIM and SH3 domain protein F42H10.3-like isoform X4 [Biomphalaria glabrata]